MKFALFLCLISISAFAQQKKEPVKKDKPVKFDSLDLEFGWDDVFRSAGWDDCRCPDTTRVWQMPHEYSPYQWVNKDKPIIISDSTYQQWIKADQAFKKNYRRVDSLMQKK
jgi:hypothetical protein